MKKQIAVGVAVVSLVVGLGSGYVIGRVSKQNGQDHTTHTHDESTPGSSHSQGTTAHKHPKFEVDPAQAPTVSFNVEEDAKSGWYVKIDTSNFKFTPENANKENVIGEGHAHLYVDGKLVSRIYGPDFHYRENFNGTRTFKVTLNGNSHADYVVNGEVVSAEQQVTHHKHD